VTDLRAHALGQLASELVAEQQAQADPARDIALMVANAVRRAKGLDNLGHAEWASMYACVRRGGGLCAADNVEAVAVADAAMARATEARTR
jgi:hypothetical protein